MLPTRIEGELEIDHDRGVIYFHADPQQDNSLLRQCSTLTILRICSLPKPIPVGKQIDITHMTGVSYGNGKVVNLNLDIQQSDLDRSIQVGDCIRLLPKHEKAASRISTYGEWWTVLSVADEQLYLQSNRLGGAPKKAATHKTDVMHFHRISALSPDYRLVQVVKGNANFSYKKHHDHSIK